jgi:hypothetical protein
MEQLFELEIEIQPGSNYDDVNVWFDIELYNKLDYHFFLTKNTGFLSGGEKMAGKLFVKHSSAITAEKLASYLSVPNDSVKSLKVAKIF